MNLGKEHINTENLTGRAHKYIKPAVLDIGRTTKVDRLDPPLLIKNRNLILNVAVHHQRLGVQVVGRAHDLLEYIAISGLVYVGPDLDIVEEVYPWQSVGDHVNVIVDVVLEESIHLHNVRMLEPVSEISAFIFGWTSSCSVLDIVGRSSTL